MTRDEILRMEPGRELDALVARKLFGVLNPDPLWRPSEDISAALEVTERFKDIRITRYVDPEMKMWKCEIQNFGVRYLALEKTMAAAICKAALLAVMDGEDKHGR